ncbi:unnamed protein product, partial [Polarella glacialis]
EIFQIQQMLISGRVTQEEFDHARLAILQRLCPEFICSQLNSPSPPAGPQRYLAQSELLKQGTPSVASPAGPIKALLAVHPPGKDLKVNVCRAGRIVKRGIASQPISLDGFPDGDDDDGALDEGHFQVLGKFTVRKSGNEVLPNFLDTCATAQQITMHVQDRPPAEALDF